jgi:hypothetical protein
LQGLWDARVEWQQWLESRFRRKQPQTKTGRSKPLGVER